MDLMQDKGLSMVEVDRKKLLTKLKENRAKHEAEYTEAKAKYEAAIVKELQTLLRNARKKDFPTHIETQPPEEYLEHYDRVITMLEMEVKDNVHITAEQAQQFVMDKWSWKHHFDMRNSSYQIGAAIKPKGRR